MCIYCGRKFLRQTTSVIPYSILLQIRQIWPWRYGEELKDFFVFCQDLLNINAPEQYCASIEPGRKCLFAPNHISHPIQYITSNSKTVWWRVEGFFCFLPRFIKYKRSRTILCIYWTWQKMSFCAKPHQSSHTVYYFKFGKFGLDGMVKSWRIFLFSAKIY